MKCLILLIAATPASFYQQKISSYDVIACVNAVYKSSSIFFLKISSFSLYLLNSFCCTNVSKIKQIKIYR